MREQMRRFADDFKVTSKRLGADTYQPRKKEDIPLRAMPSADELFEKARIEGEKLLNKKSESEEATA
jgi:hypothetical protein